jgi:two-component system cell cycle sensor histidine kinase/response regulator CckA
MNQNQATITVLLVDDDPAALEGIEAYLHGLSYTVLPVSLPTEALKTAQVLPLNLDVLITDVWMPGMDGLKLAREIVALHPSVKVLYVTGDKVAGDRLRKERLPYLLKPFSLQELREALQALSSGSISAQM